MSVDVSSTNPVRGYYASEEPRTTGDARLRSLILAGDVPDANAGFVPGSTTVGDIINAAGANRSPNRTPGNVKQARYLTNADRGVNYGITAEDILNRQNETPLNIGTVIRVEHQGDWELVFDNGTITDPAFLRSTAFVTGDQEAGNTLPVMLVPVGSPAAATANIRPITPTQPDPPFVLDDIGTYTRGGVEGFYRYKAPAGGAYGVPTGLDDANWRQVAPPTTREAIAVVIPRDIFYQAYQDEALGQYAGKLLIITGRVDGNGSPRPDVYVHCAGPNIVEYADAYTLEIAGGVPQFLPVRYTVSNDTTGARSIAEQYVRVVGDPADNNLIIGAPNDDNVIGGGPGLVGNNLIVGGGANTIPDGYQNGVFSSNACLVQGNFNQVYGGDGCVIPTTCQYVTLINCTGSLVIPPGTNRKTYIDNNEVGGGALDIYARNNQAEADRIAALFTSNGQVFAFDPTLTAPYPFASVVVNFGTGDVYTLVPNYNAPDASGNAAPYWSRPA